MKRLEGEKYVTVGWVPSMISFLRKRMEDARLNFPSHDDEDEENNGDNECPENEQVIEDFLPDLVKKMSKDFDNRFGNIDERQFDGTISRGFMNRQIGIHPTIVLASVLDPRFKSLSCFWMQEDKDSIWSCLLDEMKIYASTIPFNENEDDNGLIHNPRRNANVDHNELDQFLIDLEHEDGDEFILNNNANQNNGDGNENNDQDRITRMCELELNEYRKLPTQNIYNHVNNKFECPLRDFGIIIKNSSQFFLNWLKSSCAFRLHRLLQNAYFL